jgi:hypothetical protein
LADEGVGARKDPAASEKLSNEAIFVERLSVSVPDPCRPPPKGPALLKPGLTPSMSKVPLSVRGIRAGLAFSPRTVLAAPAVMNSSAPELTVMGVALPVRPTARMTVPVPPTVRLPTEPALVQAPPRVNVPLPMVARLPEPVMAPT